MPHTGCKHQCTFCNQREITGQQYLPCAEDVVRAAVQAEKDLGERTKNAEIAFFGGSFTAIKRSYMTELLDAAYPFVADGRFYGIRLSTRPDAIDREVLDLLEGYGVTSIELGAQSMNDDVLQMNRRGHTAEDVEKASSLIKQYGFSLGLQMMTGMYGSDDDKDRETARRLAALSPDTVRIYPTVVMTGTELYDLYKSGKYIPQTVEQAVELCAGLLEYFEEKGISVIRLGLHDSESLRSSMAAGAFHPAMRELCESRIMLRKTLDILDKKNIHGGTVQFGIAPCSVSRFTGQKRCNINALRDRGIIAVIRQNPALGKYDIVPVRKEERKGCD